MIEFFNAKMQEAKLNTAPGNPVIAAQINLEQNFAFIEVHVTLFFSEMNLFWNNVFLFCFCLAVNNLVRLIVEFLFEYRLIVSLLYPLNTCLTLTSCIQKRYLGTQNL